MSGWSDEVSVPVTGSAADRSVQGSHFATDHLLKDLKGHAVRGGSVTLAAQAVQFGLNLVSIMVLARLLTPADFGLVAMVTAITGFVAMFKDAGLSMATVQRGSITHAQVSTLFWINVALSVLLMGVVAALAPAVAAFYGEPALVLVTLAIAGTFLFGGLAVQHTALLKRQMRFTAIAVKDVASMAAGIAVAIVLALLGAGYWALVAMTATTGLIGMAAAWALSGWRPGLPRRGAGVRPMLAFGGFLTGSSFLAYVRRNIDNVLIGAVFGSVALGLYQKAYQILMLPIRQVNSPVTNVVVPTLSRLQSEPERFRRYYSKALLLMTSVGMPVVGLAFVAAGDIVLLVLGDQWLDAVPIFIALSPAAFAGTINVAGGWIFVSTGRSDRQFIISLILTVFYVSAMVAGLPWGVLGVATAFSIAFCVARLPHMAYAVHGSAVQLADVGRALWRPALSAIGAALVTVAVAPRDNGWNVLATFALSASCYAATYVAIWRLAPNGRDAQRLVVNAGRALRKK